MKFGCDEAGRGPVVGSMFVCCAYGREDLIPKNVQDSKNLTNNQVVQMRTKIEDSEIEYSVIEITSDDIDDRDSMTTLSAKAFADSISKSNIKDETSGIIDCFSNDKDKARRLVNNRIDNGIKVDSEFKADENYPIVSASSIIAKSYREEHIDELSEQYGEVGSGYPSDPTTREFLEDYVSVHGELPACARESWSTSTDILEDCT
jgi:ribonuclease HII